VINLVKPKPDRKPQFFAKPNRKPNRSHFLLTAHPYKKEKNFQTLSDATSWSHWHDSAKNYTGLIFFSPSTHFPRFIPTDVRLLVFV